MPRYRFLGEVTQSGVAFYVNASDIAAAHRKINDGDYDDIDFGPAEVTDIKLTVGTGEAA